MPRSQECMAKWASQFSDLGQVEGDIDVIRIGAADISYGGTFVVHALGRRLFIDVLDYGWTSYDFDRCDDDEPYGFNTLIHNIADLDTGKVLALNYDIECAEDDSYQGLGRLLIESIDEKSSLVTVVESWRRFTRELVDRFMYDEN